MSLPSQRIGAPAIVARSVEIASAPSRASDTTTWPATGTSPARAVNCPTPVPAPSLMCFPSHARSAVKRAAAAMPAASTPSVARKRARSMASPRAATRCDHGAPKPPRAYEPSIVPPANEARESDVSSPSRERCASPSTSSKANLATSRWGDVTVASTRNSEAETVAVNPASAAPASPAPMWRARSSGSSSARAVPSQLRTPPSIRPRRSADHHAPWLRTRPISHPDSVRRPHAATLPVIGSIPAALRSMLPARRTIAVIGRRTEPAQRTSTSLAAMAMPPGRSSRSRRRSSTANWRTTSRNQGCRPPAAPVATLPAIVTPRSRSWLRTISRSASRTWLSPISTTSAPPETCPGGPTVTPSSVRRGGTSESRASATSTG